MIKLATLLAAAPLGILLQVGPTPAAHAPNATPNAAARPLNTPAPPTPTPTPVPGEVRVLVTVSGDGQSKAPAAGAVVWIPGSTAPAAQKAPARAKVTSKDKRFDPHVAVVPVGGTVDFPNVDKIYHNVFSVSEKSKFDLGLYKNGASNSKTFENPGLVKIYCNIHPQMAGYLMVVDGAVYAQTGADGTATLPNLKPGRYTVRVWDEKGGDRSETADVVSGRVTMLNVALDASAWREVPHKNKHGKDYPPPDDDENRY